MQFFSRMKINRIKGFFFTFFIFFISTNSYAVTDSFYNGKLDCFNEDTSNKLPKPTQGLLDKNEYQFIQLENDLKALLITDESAQKACVSMNVSAGSVQDPNDRLGLAHLLEHMVLKGSKKYPVADNFENFMVKNGGLKNAYTDGAITNYYYSVNLNSLEESLDRFAHLFICPSLDASYIEKECHVVDSEHKGNIHSDGRVIQRVLDNTANINNPGNRFSTGDLTTLHNEDNSLYPELKNFFECYYVANNMNLVIYSNHSISELKQLVVDNFSTIKSGIKTENNKELYINPEQQGVEINIQTINDIDYLSMEFYIPFEEKYQFSPALDYIEDFFRSCFFYPLKNKGLLLDLSLYYSLVENNHIRYRFHIELAKEGTKNIEEISAIFFDTIDYIKKADIQYFIADEFKRWKQQKFDYSVELATLYTVSQYSRRMSHYSLEHVLDVRNYYDDLTVDSLNAILNNLTWQNSRIIVANNKVDANTKIEFYDSKYKILPFSEEFINRLENPKKQDYFKIPESNSFIANDLSIKSKPNYQRAKKIVDDSGIKSWYMPDNQFNVPNGNINILLSNNLTSQNADNVVLNSIYANAVNRFLLDKIQNPAAIAGIKSYAYAAEKGIAIEISGFQDKQLIVLESYIEKLKGLAINQNEFNLIKQQVIDSLMNKEFLQPYSIANNKLKEIVNPYIFADDKLIATTKKLTLADLEKFISDFWLKINIQMLVYGNYTENEAYNITSTVKNSFLTDDNAIDKPMSFRKSIEGNIVFSSEVNNNNSCCINYYRTKNNDLIYAHALTRLTRRLLAVNFFRQLRTEEQLGYTVWIKNVIIAHEPWISFIVQSDVKNPEYISNRIDSFLRNQIIILEEMTDREFVDYKTNLAKDLLKLPSNTENAAADIWEGIDYYNGDLEIDYHIAQEIKKIEKQDVVNMLNYLTTKANSLSIQMWSNQDKKDKATADKNQHALTKIEQVDKFSLIPY